MSRQDLFERILKSLHAAVLDDARWPATAGLIDESCGSTGNFMVFGDGDELDGNDILFARLCFRGQRREDLERLYFKDYHAVDERLPRIRQLADGHVVHVSSLFTEEETKTSLVYNEWLPLCRTVDGVTVRLDGPDRSSIVWIVGDPVEGDGWSPGRVATIERLLPHLRQFVRVRQELVDATAVRASVTGFLNTGRTGVIQLDRRARMMAGNDRARALLRMGDGLSEKDGVLHASLRKEDAELQRLLAQALPLLGGPEAGGSMLVSRPRSLPRLVLHVSPVNEGGMESRQSRVGALVLVVDPASRAGIDPRQVGAILGLTPAESHVAVSLAQGKTIRDIAVATGRSETTIRWHIKHMFAKHGLSRQVELVQLVMSLADAPGTWR